MVIFVKENRYGYVYIFAPKRAFPNRNNKEDRKRVLIEE